MEARRTRALVAANRYANHPGYFEARLTRAYTADQKRRGLGMMLEDLKNIESNPEAPVRITHSTADAGRTFHAEYDPRDEFLNVRGLINVGDGGAGDQLYAGYKNGDLRYVSACFTVPMPNDPAPERFRSRLLEVSFVPEPHEPHAEILVCHGRSDDAPNQRRLTLCGALVNPTPAAMSAKDAAAAAAAANPASDEAAPKSSTTLAELKKQLDQALRDREELKSRLQQTENEVKTYKAEEERTLAPRIDFFKGRVASSKDLPAEAQQAVNEVISALATSRETRAAFDWFEGQLKHTDSLAAELAKANEERTKLQESQNEVEQFMKDTSAAASRGGFSASSAPTSQQQQAPLVAQHSVGGGVRSLPQPTSQGRQFADFIEKKIRERRDEINGVDHMPPAKRQMEKQA